MENQLPDQVQVTDHIRGVHVQLNLFYLRGLGKRKAHTHFPHGFSLYALMLNSPCSSQLKYPPNPSGIALEGHISFFK